MLSIAIDGYVGSGKSTLAHALAKKLGLKVLDTGAIYRSITCFYQEKFGNLISSDMLKLLSKTWMSKWSLKVKIKLFLSTVKTIQTK